MERVHVRTPRVGSLHGRFGQGQLGNTPAALTEFNRVRTRAGMPEITASDLTPERTLMDRIRRERRIELAFEELRYFDAHRWMIAPDVHENEQGVRIHGNLDSDGELLATHRYSYRYQVFDVGQREWDNASYFVPTAQEEMNRNPERGQNPGHWGF